MKRLLLSLAGCLVLAAFPAQLAARDLKMIAELPDHTQLFLDRSSVRRVGRDGKALREAIVSIDNRRDALADIKVEADCAARQLRVIWSRVFNRETGAPRSDWSIAPHALASPRGQLEVSAFKAICEVP